jgi:succinate dehydrogenase / fumarate reductase flavoprotein subunit
MWEYGGVVKNESKLQTGLSKINDLKEASKNLDVRPDSEGYQDLMLAFDLEASIVSSEATLLSALNREESRGAHQRDDFKEISEKENVNIRIELEDDNKLKLSKQDIPKLSKELQSLINETKNIEDFEGMLLE